jgi:uncharacterized membrane protein YoaT (DUF817 family)
LKAEVKEAYWSAYFITLKSIHRAVSASLALTGSERREISLLKQFLLFVYLQALSCIFPVIIFLSLALSSLVTDVIPRYDFLLLVCVLAQVVLYLSGMETRDEVYVITMFHLLGLIMEIHKVQRGAWSYPEEAYTKFIGVPLYAGFMYASVGSYICQAWRNLSLEVINWPSTWVARICGIAIYLNFFSNAFIPDLRWYIVAVLAVAFWRTKFSFRLDQRTYYMPAIVSFMLIGFFIWMGENIATFYGAWKYAYQHVGWKMVKWHKISSWSLLVIVSVIIVGELKKLKSNRLTAE